MLRQDPLSDPLLTLPFPLQLKSSYRIACMLILLLTGPIGSLSSFGMQVRLSEQTEISPVNSEVGDQDDPKHLVTDRSNLNTSELSLKQVRELGSSQSRFASDQLRAGGPNDASGDDMVAQHQQRLSDYSDSIKPILQEHCSDCHSGDQVEGNFRFDRLNPDLVLGGDTDWWLELFAVVTKGEMPPADSEPLSSVDRDRLVEWLSQELRVASTIRRKTQQYSAFRRLTNYEYNYALQDLLGVEWDFSKDLPPEAQSEDGFVNRSDLLHISVNQFEMYHRIARESLGRLIVTGEQPVAKHWLITADHLAKREWAAQDERLAKLKEELKDKPEELDTKTKELLDGFTKRPGGAYYENRETGRFARAQWAYYNAKYANAPIPELGILSDDLQTVAVLPNGSGHRLIFELGNQLPDYGTLRVTAEVAKLDSSADSTPSLQLMFGWQASNEGRALMVVSKDDVAITGTLENPQLVQWDVPLGEIYPRNSVRKSSPMGVTPSPSEYVRIVNNSVTPSSVQIRYITVSSPVYEQWPPSSHRRLLGVGDEEIDEAARAEIILQRLMLRAWRGNVTAAEVARKVQRFKQFRASSDSFESAMIEVLAIVLSSPKFLYVAVPPRSSESDPVISGSTIRNSSTRKQDRSDRDVSPVDLGEVKDRNDQKQFLSDGALAERLALFLWCSVPDKELLSLAQENQLSHPDHFAAQVERMIRDPKSKRFVSQFVRQWLNLELLEFQNFKTNVPGFDPLLKQAMLAEPVEFINEMLQENESILDLLHCEFAMINERLARHYGIPGVSGNHFRRVAVPDPVRRGGLITQAGFLAMNSDWPDSHPLKRSIWLLERILHDPPPPPPPAVPQIDLADPRVAQMTLKERMEDHRNQAACASCHIKIDPWGIAFENYDALGRWRDSIDGKPVDSESELFNGEKLEGIEGLKRFLLMNRQDQLAQAVVEKILAYSLGRALTFADQSGVEQICAEVRSQGDGLQEVILAIVESDLFLQW